MRINKSSFLKHIPLQNFNDGLAEKIRNEFRNINK